MRSLIFLATGPWLLAAVICSCSPKDDPCVRAVDAAQLLVTEHEKFEVAVADAAMAWRMRRPGEAAEAKARAQQIAPEIQRLKNDFGSQAEACGRR